MNSKKNLIRRMIGAALAVLMVVSMFAAVPFTASAEDGASATGETVYLDFNADNAIVGWNNDIDSWFWYISVWNDDYYFFLDSSYSDTTQSAAGTYDLQDEGVYYHAENRQLNGSPNMYFTNGSFTVNVYGDIAIVSCTFLGDDGKNYIITITNGRDSGFNPDPGTTYYTLTLDLQIASFVEGSDWEMYSGSGNGAYITMPKDTVLTLPTASEMIAEGYSFRGWFTWDQISSGQTDTGATTYTFTQNGTLSAKWTPNTYTVTVDPNGGYRRIMYTSAGAVYRNTNAYTVSTVYGGWLRLFGNDGPIQRDGYRLVGFTGVNGGSTVGSFIDPVGNPSVFNDPNNYYYRIGPTDETLVAQWEKIPDQINVTIGDQIGVNLMLNLDARNAETVTVKYKDLNGNEQTETFTDFNSLPRTDEGLYKIAVQIAPAQIADSVAVYVDGETLSASVKDYCNTLAEGGYGEEVAALAQAVLDYGQAANNFFDYTDEAMSTLANLTADDAKAWEKQLSDTTGKLRALSFMALTKPEFRFYTQGITEAEAAAYNAAGVTAAYTNSGITDILTARFVKNAQGSILIEVTGVQAEYMDETIVVTVPGLGTITFAGNDFAKMMADNAALETLGAALYAYGAAAKACFA